MPGAAKSPIPADPPADPLRLFEAWHAEAVACSGIKYAHAACLSTTGLDDLPDARIVLAELHEASAFVFFTDAGSVKGQSLVRSPEAALTFYWGPLDRQIRIRGGVEPGSEDLSDRCFSQRPRAAQITAWASRQSRERRAGELEQRVEAFTERFADSDSVPPDRGSTPFVQRRRASIAGPVSGVVGSPGSDLPGDGSPSGDADALPTRLYTGASTASGRSRGGLG